MDAKYIVVSDKPSGDGGYEKMIIFDASMIHKDMVKAMGRLRFPYVLAAGFINENMECYGYSQSCHVGYRDIDDIMLHAMLNMDIHFHTNEQN